MTSKLASIVLTTFTLMLLAALPAVGGVGVMQAIPPLLPTAAFAQPFSSSLADGIIDETSASLQDSSSDDNLLGGSNEFADEDAAIDQDNTEEQDDANVGLQDQDGVQEQDESQDAANTNVDSDVQVGEQLPPTPTPTPTPTPAPTPTPTPTPTPEPLPPTEQVFCFDFILATFGQIQACTETLAACEDLQALVGSDPNNSILEGCHPVEQIV
jgi:hypothetical protein